MSSLYRIVPTNETSPATTELHFFRSGPRTRSNPTLISRDASLIAVNQKGTQRAPFVVKLFGRRCHSCISFSPLGAWLQRTLPPRILFSYLNTNIRHAARKGSICGVDSCLGAYRFIYTFAFASLRVTIQEGHHVLSQAVELWTKAALVFSGVVAISDALLVRPDGCFVIIVA